MKRLIAFFTLVALAVGVFVTTAFADTDTVTVFHTNDIHGYVESAYDGDGNLTKLGMEHVAALKKAHPDAILIDAGDFDKIRELTAEAAGIVKANR